MNALLLHTPGENATLDLTNVERPKPSSNEVLIEVAAIAINPVDVKVRDMAAVADMICGDTRPFILGWDVAGTVAEVGDQVTDYQVGDRVFGMANFPGIASVYADFVPVPADQLAVIPKGTSFEEAAATTLAALTAVQVLRDRVKAGDHVLIHAGSGGVGHYAIQLAKRMGAKVTTTCSARNRQVVMDLGADAHIDYHSTAFDQVLSDVDMVIDALGGDNVLRCVNVTKSGGRVVSLPSPEFDEAAVAAAEARGISLAFVLVTSSGQDMKHLAELLGAGELKVLVHKTFHGLSEMDAAHAAVRSGRTVGKVVVRL